jgi:hypothetical protein
MSLFKKAVCVTAFFGIPAMFYCGKTDPLTEVEQMIAQQQYEAALARLDAILAKEPENKKAQLLRINAAMLQKSNQRNNCRTESLTTTPPANGPRAGTEGGKNRAGTAQVIGGAGFSIMSLCTDKSGGEVSDLAKKLEN